MVEKAAEDYAKYFKCCNIENEINPICLSIEEMLTRLDEFESLISNVKAETNSIMQEHIIGTVGYKKNLKSIQERIDKLEKFVDIVNENVNAVEKSVDLAETELNITDYSLKGLLFKPLFKQTVVQETNSEYRAIPIFKTSEYFEICAEEANVTPDLKPLEMISEQDQNL